MYIDGRTLVYIYIYMIIIIIIIIIIIFVISAASIYHLSVLLTIVHLRLVN